MVNKEVRTRFAPSPTGMLHIGGFRTAIYAWLLARSTGGKFLLRVEDTDQTRKVPGAIRYILEGFEWFGIDIDEGPTAEELARVDDDVEGLPAPGGDYGPYVQSLRKARYLEVAEGLITAGHAFRCDCTPEMLEAERREQQERKETPGYGGRCRARAVSADQPHVVRFKMPDDTALSIVDGVRAEISWKSVPLRDPVLLKADGLPTYHLAVVVDDHDMHITHVMRGEEWIPSTPLHVYLYQALGWELPTFCHLPVVMGADGKKLSKRHGATSWSSFKDDGYLPEALLNFVALIGWSPGEGEEQEIFSREDLIERFSLERVNSASAVFDYSKLQWMNGVYLREMPVGEFSKLADKELAAAGLSIAPESLQLLLPHVQERVKVLPDIAPLLAFMQTGGLEWQLDQFPTKKLSPAAITEILQECRAVLAEATDLSAAAVEPVIKSLAEKLALKPGMILISLRIATTGSKTALPLFESIEALGQTEVVARIDHVLELLVAGEKGDQAVSTGG